MAASTSLSISARAIGMLFAGGLMIVALVVGITMFMRTAQNDLAAKGMLQMIEGGVQSEGLVASSFAKDYGWWDDGYRKFSTVDTAWLLENYGLAVLDTKVMDVLALASKDGTVTNAWTSEDHEMPADQVLPKELVALLRAQLPSIPGEGPGSAFTYFVLRGQLYGFAISYLNPVETIKDVKREDRPIVIVAKLIDGERLSAIGANFLVNEISFTKDIPPGKSALPIKTVDGHALGYIVWTSPSPGDLAMRNVALPVGAMILAVFAAMAWLGWSIRALERKLKASQLADSERTIAAVRSASEQEQALALEAAARARRDHLETVISELRDKIAVSLSDLNTRGDNLDRTAHSLTSVVSEASTAATSSHDASNETARHVVAVASGAEQLARSIDNVAANAKKAGELVEKTKTSVSATDSDVARLSASVDDIGMMASLIHSIAQKTNLLALNATIEAARAGEAGRGFSVVASEVKLLAHQTAEATTEISAKIATIRDSAGSTVQTVHELKSFALELGQLTEALEVMIAEQKHGTREIANSIADAAAGSEVAARNVMVVNGSISLLQQSAETLDESALGIRSASRSVIETVDQFMVKAVGG
jgi:methyl-accepting chemotaxis protein